MDSRRVPSSKLGSIWLLFDKVHSFSNPDLARMAAAPRLTLFSNSSLASRISPTILQPNKSFRPRRNTSFPVLYFLTAHSLASVRNPPVSVTPSPSSGESCVYEFR